MLNRDQLLLIVIHAVSREMNPFSIQNSAGLHKICYITLHRHVNRKLDRVIEKRERRKGLKNGEERLIAQAVEKYSNNHKPLFMNAMKDCVALFVLQNILLD